ncbi:MAG: protein tyrosine phosphatase family protein [Gammaproteobacteria bacterium]|nr:protein tyrosine phosphatase family protein [Gammaproteobacteria bacterium]
MPALSDIPNFRVVDSEIFTAGQPSRDQFSIIAEEGFETVINLAMLDSLGALEDEAAVVKSFKMEYVHIPVPFDAPELSQFLRFEKVLLDLKQEACFIHCIANKRVSVFMYLFAIRHRKDAQEIERMMLSVWQPNKVWRVFIKNCLVN